MFKFLKFNASKKTKSIVMMLAAALVILAKVNSSKLDAEPTPKYEGLSKSDFGEVKVLFELPKLVASGANNELIISDFYVIDGDTIKDDENISYRIAYIDAPELEQPLGNEARIFLDSLLKGKTIRAKVLYEDQYKRKVSIIYVGQQDIAELLVMHGYAYNESSKYNAPIEYQRWLSEIEYKAKMGAKGIWGGDYIKPYEYRKSNEYKYRL